MINVIQNNNQEKKVVFQVEWPLQLIKYKLI